MLIFFIADPDVFTVAIIGMPDPMSIIGTTVATDYLFRERAVVKLAAFCETPFQLNLDEIVNSGIYNEI